MPIPTEDKKEIVMAQKKDAAPKPPYLAYKTFDGVINGWDNSGLPTRIDKSLFSSQSGGVQGQIISALEFLGLISDGGVPTSTLTELVSTDKAGRQPIFWKILRGRYTFIFTEDFDLEKTTPAQLDERFRSQDIEGETIRKSVTFFLQACEAANISVSPHIKTRRKRSSSRRPRRSSNNSRSSDNNGNGSAQSGSTDDQNTSKSLDRLVLEKFPEFDPSWSEEQQKNWYEAFDALHRRLAGENADEAEEDG